VVRYGKYVSIICIILFSSISISAQEYAVNTYDIDDTSGFKQVKTKIIDLDSKSIVNEILISDIGYITSKIPVVYHRGRSTYLISVVLEGCYCKNSIPGIYKSNISIIDSTTKQLIYSHSDTNIIIFDLAQNSDNSVFISGEIKHPNEKTIYGDFVLKNNLRFRLKNQRPVGYHPHRFIELDRFTFYEPIDTLKQLYKANSSGNRFILKTDREVIFDSLQQNNDPERSLVFASKDSLLYVFHQNYEFYGKMIQKSRDDDWIQSHVLIYDGNDFSLVDSIAIPDYPEGEYIAGDFGVADVVGDYIVHYFFPKGGLEDFEPAMLFIFDTRTNETTWLRVGWR